MTNPKHTKKNFDISRERLAELRRRTLIESTSSSLRLSDSKVTNQQVEQILKAVNRFSEQK